MGDAGMSPSPHQNLGAPIGRRRARERRGRAAHPPMNYFRTKTLTEQTLNVTIDSYHSLEY
jgi:hypothetical protein